MALFFNSNENERKKNVTPPFVENKILCKTFLIRNCLKLGKFAHFLKNTFFETFLLRFPFFNFRLIKLHSVKKSGEKFFSAFVENLIIYFAIMQKCKNIRHIKRSEFNFSQVLVGISFDELKLLFHLCTLGCCKRNK